MINLKTKCVTACSPYINKDAICVKLDRINFTRHFEEKNTEINNSVYCHIYFSLYWICQSLYYIKNETFVPKIIFETVSYHCSKSSNSKCLYIFRTKIIRNVRSHLGLLTCYSNEAPLIIKYLTLRHVDLQIYFLLFRPNIKIMYFEN